jgi:hypothetical protein
MPNLLGFLSGPVKGLVGEIGNILDKITTTDKEKLEAQRKLAELQFSFNAKLAEIEAEWVKSQRDVIVAEAGGKSWLQRNWRPILMLFFAVVIGTVVWTGGWINGRQLNSEFVMEILSIIKLGLGGYVIGRSVEKVAPSVAEMFGKK